MQLLLLLANMEEIHITALYGAISGLAGGLAWVAKLFYVDVKKAQADCEARHDKTKIEYESRMKDERIVYETRLNEERKECNENLAEHKAVINTLQGQVNTLTANVFDIMKGPNSGIHHQS